VSSHLHFILSIQAVRATILNLSKWQTKSWTWLADSLKRLNLFNCFFKFARCTIECLKAALFNFFKFNVTHCRIQLASACPKLKTVIHSGDLDKKIFSRCITWVRPWLCLAQPVRSAFHRLRSSDSRWWWGVGPLLLCACRAGCYQPSGLNSDKTMLALKRFQNWGTENFIKRNNKQMIDG
jgi:hypothetical protein